MTLYVLISETTNYEGHTAHYIHGIFSTPQKAEDAKMELNATNWPDMEIETIELDELDGGYQICL